MAGVRERGQPGTAPGPRSGNAAGGGQDSADGTPAGGDGALVWSVAAMTDALRRLDRASAADMPLAVAAATEAVWWVTVVDAAMSRRHPGAYRRALAALDPAARRAVEGSLAGLRFIRGQLGYSADPGDFIQPAHGARPAAQWTWSAVPPPAPQRGSARDVSPYREYRAQLAGRPVAEVLGRAAGFLSKAHAAAARDGHHGPASAT
jgi:hypothetical protein